MDGNSIRQKQDWTKSFGPKPVGRKEVGRKLGTHMYIHIYKQLLLISDTLYFIMLSIIIYCNFFCLF